MPGKKLLTKAEILQVQDIRALDVEVPEWGGCVRINVMNGTERERFEMWAQSKVGPDGKSADVSDVRATLLSLVLVDDKGERMFEASDVKAISGKNGAVLSRLADQAMRVNGLTKESAEEMRKNS